MTLAIACSGGGNWCIAQLGFIYALHERGYRTQAASGVSFGTWAAYSAVTSDVLGVMARIRRFRELLDMNLMQLWKHRTTPREIVSRMERALRGALPERVETQGDYYVMAVKLPTMQTVAFDKAHALPEILRAAMAMPPLPAARYDGHVLRDAGLRLKYGIRPLVEAGYRRILCLGSFDDYFPGRWRAWKRLLPHYRSVDVHEVVMPMHKKIGVVEFTRSGSSSMDAVFEEGYTIGRRYPARHLDHLSNRCQESYPVEAAVVGA